MLDDRDDGSAIDVRGVTKHFGALCVLDRISCRFERGRTTVVIGPSGSGKSTLARCICGLETYDAGSITLFGEDVASLRSRPRAMSRRTGMIFQHFNLWPHMTALENVAFAPRRCLKMDEGQARELASSLLERVGLKNKARHKPGRLSGGEQQRVAIARAQDYSRTLSALGFAAGARYTIERFGLSATTQEICDEWNQMGRTLYESNVELRPGAENYICALHRRGIPVALATTNDRDVLDAMRHVDVNSLFDVRVHTGELGLAKDRPEVYLDTAQRLGVRPEECLCRSEERRVGKECRSRWSPYH